MAVNQFQRPADLDLSFKFYQPNWAELDKTLGVLQEEYDQTRLASQQVPEYNMSDADVVKQYTAKNAEAFNRVGSLFAQGKFEDARKEMSALQYKVIRDWSPGGEPAAILENKKAADQAVAFINDMQAKGLYSAERAQYELDRVKKHQTQYQNGIYSRFQYDAAPKSVLNPMERALKYADEHTARWSNEGYKKVGTNWFKNNSEFKTEQDLYKFIKGSLGEDIDLVQDLERQAFEQGITDAAATKAFVESKIDELAKISASGKWYEKSDEVMIQGPSSDEFSSGSAPKPKKNIYDDLLSMTETYGADPYIKLDTPTDAGVLAKSRELERQIKDTQTSLETNVNAELRKLDPSITSGVKVDYSGNKVSLVIDPKFRTKYPTLAANIEAQYKDQVAQLEVAVSQRNALQRLRSEYIDERGINPSILAQLDKNREAFIEATRVSTFTTSLTPGSWGAGVSKDSEEAARQAAAQYLDSDEFKDQLANFEIEQIKKLDPANAERYIEYYDRLKALSSTIVLNTTGYVLGNAAGDPELDRIEKNIGKLALSAIIGNTELRESSTNKVLTEQQRQQVRDAVIKATGEELTESSVNFNTNPIILRYDVDSGRTVAVVSIPNIEGRGTKSKKDNLKVEVDLGTNGNLTQLSIQLGAINTREVELEKHIHNQLKLSGGVEAVIGEGAAQAVINPVFTQDGEQSILEYDINIAGVKTRVPTAKAAGKLQFDAEVVQQYLINGTEAQLTSLVQAYPELNSLSLPDDSFTERNKRIIGEAILGRGAVLSQPQAGILYDELKKANPYNVPADATYFYDGKPITRDVAITYLLSGNAEEYDKLTYKSTGKDTEFEEIKKQFAGTSVVNSFTNATMLTAIRGPKRLTPEFTSIADQLFANLKDVVVTGMSRTPKQNYDMRQQEGSTAAEHSKHLSGEAIDIKANATTEASLASLLGISQIEIGKVYEHSGLKILKHKNSGQQGYHIHIER